MKILLKCACDQEQVVQSGNVSRGFHCHADRQKVIVVNLGYFSVENIGEDRRQIRRQKTDIEYKRHINGFPCVILYINSEVAVMIGHYIIYFENILVFILLLF